MEKITWTQWNLYENFFCYEDGGWRGRDSLPKSWTIFGRTASTVQSIQRWNCKDTQFGVSLGRMGRRTIQLLPIHKYQTLEANGVDHPIKSKSKSSWKDQRTKTEQDGRYTKMKTLKWGGRNDLPGSLGMRNTKPTNVCYAKRIGVTVGEKFTK